MVRIRGPVSHSVPLCHNPTRSEALTPSGPRKAERGQEAAAETCGAHGGPLARSPPLTQTCAGEPQAVQPRSCTRVAPRKDGLPVWMGQPGVGGGGQLGRPRLQRGTQCRASGLQGAGGLSRRGLVQLATWGLRPGFTHHSESLGPLDVTLSLPCVRSVHGAKPERRHTCAQHCLRSGLSPRAPAAQTRASLSKGRCSGTMRLVTQEP